MSDNLTNNLDDHGLLLQLVSLVHDFDVRRRGMDESFIARLGSIDERLGSIDERLGSIGDRFGSIEDRLGSIEDRLGSIDERFGSIEDRLVSLSDRLGSLEDRLGSLEDRLGSLEDRLGSLEVRFEALEKKVDERLYDTRPMWEAVQVQISELRESTEKGFRKLDSKWEMLAREVRELYADEREVERRVGNLESKVS